MDAQAAIVGLLLLDAISRVESFVTVFIWIYSLVILMYIIVQWIRLPYSAWGSRIQQFLYDVCEPYLRLFRRILPPLGPLDLSPMVGIVVLVVIRIALISILEQFH
jgi:YggT family protein